MDNTFVMYKNETLEYIYIYIYLYIYFLKLIIGGKRIYSKIFL